MPARADASPADPAFDRGAVVAALGLVTACILQAPGRLATDTKLDLGVDPAGFLARSLHLIDPQAAFGRIPDQGAGYLFPMGPFFALGHGLSLPMWIVQRLWLALLLVTAMLGVRFVAKRLGIGSSGTQTAAGLAYALAPAVLGPVGLLSGGLLPTALAPWALLPLIGEIRSPRRAAAWSGLAVLCMGGINAASTGGALLVPVVWLATRQRGPLRRRLIAWWILAVFLATMWWTVALAVQYRYGSSFTSYTETARITTADGSLTELLRGTSYWLGYLFRDGPWLPGAWDLIRSPVAIVATVLVAGGGLAGLSRRNLPERRFLTTASVLGVVCLGIGYAGPWSGPFSSIARSLLEGPLVALRNVVKFDPLLRLPLALGFAHLASVAGRAASARRPTYPALGAAASAATFVVITAGVIPIASGHLTTPGSFSVIPSYWRATARWLSHHDGAARALLLPASAFGEYTWGRPLDEPLQVQAASPWAVRDLVPLGSTGSTRILDLVERRLLQGNVDLALLEVLARSGVKHLVVRNDLDLVRTGAAAPGLVRAVLKATPGLHRVATFGPRVAAGLTTDRLVSDPVGTLHAVEIYELASPTPRVVTYPVADTWQLSGGPDGLVALAEHGALDGHATVLTGDPTGTANGAALAWTDALRRRDVDFGQVRDNFSYSLSQAESSPNTHQTAHDRLVLGGASHLALVEPDRAVSERASSYGPLGRRGAEYQPYAAVDGDPDTAWVAAPRTFDRRPWIELTFHRARTLGDAATVQTLLDQLPRPWPTRIIVTTDRGRRASSLKLTENTQQVAVPPGRTHSVRFTLVGFGGDLNASNGPGIRELHIPGVTVSRVVALPADGRAPRYRGTPTVLLERLRADPFSLARRDEEGILQRSVDLRAPADFVLSGTAVPRPGAALDALISAATKRPLRAVASSTWNVLPAFGAANAFDDNPNTTWVAQPTDPEPALDLRWDGARSIDRVEVEAAPGPVHTPNLLRIESPAGTRVVRVAPGKLVTFAPLVTDRLHFTFPVPTGAQLSRAAGGGHAAPPMGLAELRLPALSDLVTPMTVQPIELPCGDGPTVNVDGHIVATAIRTDTARIAAMAPVELHVCPGTITLDAGRNVIGAKGAGPFAIATLALSPAARPGPAVARRAVRVDGWGITSRHVTIGSGPRSYLVLDENFNEGWHATFRGHGLVPVRIDGWREGFVVPTGGVGTVAITFTPDRWYRAGLLAGIVAVLALLALALAPSRRAGPGGLLGPRRPGRPSVMVALATLAVLAVAGPIALVVPLLLFLPGRNESLSALAGVSFLSAGVVVLLAPGATPGFGAGAFSGAAQLLAGLALGALALTLVEPRAHHAGG